MSDRVPAGFYETTMHFGLAGQSGDIAVSLGWDGHDAGDPPDFGDVVTNLTILMGNISVDCSLESVTFDLGSSAADNPTHDETAGFFGLSSGTSLPPNVAILIQKRGSLGGRRHRGRAYFPGLPQSAINAGGTIDGAVVTGLQTNWDGMASAQAADGDTPALFHQSSPFTPTSVGTFTVQPVIATQRTRLRD